jgi:uncharacterized membrane protein
MCTVQFRNIPRVKEWFDRDDQIAQVNLQAKETKAVKLDVRCRVAQYQGMLTISIHAAP